MFPKICLQLFQKKRPFVENMFHTFHFDLMWLMTNKWCLGRFNDRKAQRQKQPGGPETVFIKTRFFSNDLGNVAKCESMISKSSKKLFQNWPVFTFATATVTVHFHRIIHLHSQNHFPQKVRFKFFVVFFKLEPRPCSTAHSVT